MNLTLAQKQKALFIAYNLIAIVISVTVYYMTQGKWLYFKEGENAYYRGEYAKAIEAYNKSMQLGDAPVKLLLHLADSFFAEGQFPRAIEFYRIYLQVEPNDKDAKKKLADALLWRGNLEEAEELYQQILKP